MKAYHHWDLSHVAAGLMAAIMAMGASADTISEWDPTSGLKPDEIRNPYTLSLSNGASEPILADGVLTISTGSNEQNASYFQIEPVVHTASGFTFVANVRLESGSSSGIARGPITMFFTTDPGTGILLMIDVDHVFFALPFSVIGPEAFVDTDEVMHSYRIEYDGVGTFTLFYDDAETLSVGASVSLSDHGSLQRVGWGEGTSFAFGISEWGPVMHNSLDLIFEDNFQPPDL